MSEFNITVEGGSSVRLPTAGKYCERDIIITAEGGGVDTSDATATSEDILKDRTAYAQGTKVTGTFSLDTEISAQDNLIAQIKTALDGKASGGSSGGVTMETCTVNLSEGGMAKCVSYVEYSNGSLQGRMYNPADHDYDYSDKTLNNVVKNSTLTVVLTDTGFEAALNNAELISARENDYGEQTIIIKILGNAEISI